MVGLVDVKQERVAPFYVPASAIQTYIQQGHTHATVVEIAAVQFRLGIVLPRALQAFEEKTPASAGRVADGVVLNAYNLCHHIADVLRREELTICSVRDTFHKHVSERVMVALRQLTKSQQSVTKRLITSALVKAFPLVLCRVGK